MSVNNEIYQKAIDKWGQTAQLEMAQEEATELALAVRKFVRNTCDRTFHDLSNEIADVEIMIEQIKFMYPKITEDIDKNKKYKLNRLNERIEKK